MFIGSVAALLTTLDLSLVEVLHETCFQFPVVFLEAFILEDEAENHQSKDCDDKSGYVPVEFYYKEKEAFVCFEDHGKVYLTWDDKTNIYLNTDDFHKNARLDNKLLSEIWDEVEYADYR